MSLFYNISSMNHKTQKEDFFLVRPDGYPKYSFVHFMSPVKILQNGVNIVASPDTVILIPPRTPHALGAANQTLVQNYVHFEVEDACYFDSLAFPLNMIFYTDIGETISYIVEEITWLFSPDTIKNVPEYRDQSSNLLHQLFIDISVAYKRLNTTNVKEINIHKEFDGIRKNLYENPQSWNVQKMADAASFSRTRFSVIYKDLYHVTPQEDIIQASLNLAKKLLATSNFTLSEIAYQCGYESSAYLVRLFKSRESMTPGKFREIIALRDR